MPDTVRVMFLYAIGQQVRHADSPRVYLIVERAYTEREVLGPYITYRLARAGVVLDTAYEPDLLPVEEDTP